VFSGVRGILQTTTARMIVAAAAIQRIGKRNGAEAVLGGPPGPRSAACASWSAWTSRKQAAHSKK
jgi:hypothetical protein